MACANTPCDEAIEFLLTAEELSEFQSMSDHSWVNTEGHQVPLKGAVWLLGKRYILPQGQSGSGMITKAAIVYIYIILVGSFPFFLNCRSRGV